MGGLTTSETVAGWEIASRNVAYLIRAFPMLMRALGHPLGGFRPDVPRERRAARIMWGGVIISFDRVRVGIHLYVAPRARHDRRRTGRRRRRPDGRLPLRRVLQARPYTESVFLLGAVGAVHHFRRGEFLAAVAWASSSA
jgi:hypothetical protein